MAENCFVYVIAGDGRSKIGVSSSPKSRLSTLQTGNPVHLRLTETINTTSRAEALEVEKLSLEFFDSIKCAKLIGEWVGYDADEVVRVVFVVRELLRLVRAFYSGPISAEQFIADSDSIIHSAIEDVDGLAEYIEGDRQWPETG